MIALPGIVIHSKIYESSVSVVYRGMRVHDNLAIAIKVLKQDYPSAQELTRYRQEYAITQNLDLTGVVKAYSQQEYQRTLVILLEDFGGESLAKWMRDRPDLCPMPLPTFLWLAIDITGILGKIHAASVIHKDINPGNIVFNPATGVVKIIDFGIATQFNRTNPTFKSPYILEGTLAYLSPEQTGRMNRAIDYRTDFYSLGVTFYELLTGHLPFTTTDPIELVHCHIAKQPIPPHDLNPTIPPIVSDLVLKLMAKNAEDRYQSAWGIKADLEIYAARLVETGRIDRFQLGLQDVADRFQIPQKLYGRDKEVDLLIAAFDRIAASQNNWEAKFKVEMILVSGYAGIGKSALVQELHKPITQKRGYFIAGKFDQLQRNIPYNAIADALQKLVQQLLGEPEDQLQKWRSQLLVALENNGQIIIDLIPEVELIVGKQPLVREVGATEAQNRFNRIFLQFVRIFCAAEHPLTIFLDDLQWIDSATLKLIELLILDEQTQFLFLIGADRDREVSQTHPLAFTLARLRDEGAVIQEIALTPLTREPLAQLIAETLHRDPNDVRDLAELVLQKTDGNPFFVSEFLRTLYSENLIAFDAECLSWEWDIDRIRATNITDNVVELTIGNLKQLPEYTQQIISFAACIGAEFDLETLAIVGDRSPQAVFADLLPAIQVGSIEPRSELDENLLIQRYKFLHDRVQQAAYALLDESQKQIIQLQIGHNLLANTLPERRADRLFEIVDRLNRGIELVTDRAERNEIARLNLLAGQKAKAAIAHHVAQKYLTAGREWLAGSSWQTNYELTLALYSETTEVAFLCGEFERVEDWVAIVRQAAKTVLDSVKVYEIKIQADIAQNQRLRAIDTGLQVLQQLGIDLPGASSQAEIQIELDTIASRFGDRQIEELIHLPEMTDPNSLAAMRILSRITIAAYIAAPDLMPLLVSTQVNLSIEHGNAFVSPFAYSWYGLIFCGIIGNIETGYQFGQLALKLLSQPNTHSHRARTLFVVNISIVHWKQYLREITQPLLAAYQIGLETGELEIAAYCAQCYCAQFYFTGMELVEVERKFAIYSEAICQIDQEAPLTWNQIFQQAIANLIGNSIDPTRLIGEFYNEEHGLPKHQAANDGTAIFCVYLNKLFLHYLFAEYDRAVENSALAEHYLLQVIATPTEPMYCLYDSLARLAIHAQSSPQVQAEILEKVAVRQEKMKLWARYAPMNYLHKYHLVQAEVARILGDLLEAEELYEQAIQGANDNDYLQEEAVAYELAAKFYLSRNREKIAKTYMKEAHYCYQRWGAMAKVRDLETRYPQLFPQSSDIAYTPIHTTAGTTSNRSDIAFDLTAVMKASQAISSEIELDRLLSSLMQILIENAGAQTGFLILENDEIWAIEASYEFNDGDRTCTTQVMQALPIANHLPESIVNYVIRTHESILLNDAICEGNYINEPYIQRHQTRSIFCLPLLNQSKLVGVLYLENQLAAGVFTPARSQVLNLLSTQAAISIENAKLYSELRQSKSRMTQFLEAVPVGIGVVDAAGRPYYANQQAIQLLGKGIDPVTPDRMAEIYQLYQAGTDRPYPIGNLPVMRALSGERTRIDDLEIHQNNAKIPVEGWGTPIFDDRGHVVYAISAFQDITERRQAEVALRESEASYRLLFENNPNPMWIYDAQTLAFLVVNDAAIQHYGYSVEEFSTMRILDIRPSPDVFRLLNHLGYISSELSMQSGEWQHCRKDSTVIDVEITSRAIDWSGIAARCVLVKDITERKRTEKLLADYSQTLERQVVERTAALQASEVELRERERELRLITDALPVCISYIDTEQRYQFINKNYENWFNCSRDRILGQPVYEVMSAEAYQTIEPHIICALAGHPTTYETELLFPCGLKYITVTNIPDFDVNNRVRGYYGLISDISEQRDAALRERNRAEAASILDERNRMAREIHDTLAQAFTSIIVHLEAASQRLTLDPDTAQSHLRTSQTLARSGLSDARRSVEALRPQILEEGDLHSALDRFAAQIFADTPVRVVCDAIGESYPLSGEVELNLLRIGQEALTNAFKYAHASAVRIELRYELTQCILQVKDNGQGFESTSLSTGRGFGLLGITERAERIGAELIIHSQLGQGTEIIVRVQMP